MTGDTLVVHDNLSKQPVLEEADPVSSWADLKIGDCIVALSSKKLFLIRDEINKFLNTNKNG